MSTPELVATAVGLVTAMASTYFGYVQVRGRIRRPRPLPSRPDDPGDAYDVFISYAPADEVKAERLGAVLADGGLRVFLAKWVDVGLVRLLESEQALLGAANGLLVLSPATMAEPAIRDEYAALLSRVHTTGRRFVPVVVEEVDLPPFAAIRAPLDLRGIPLRQYQTHIGNLVRALARPDEG